MSEATNQCIKETLREQGNVLSPHVVAQCIDDLQADNAALREQVKRLSTCGTDHSTPWWQVKCEDLEAQLATIRAQLRQVEGALDEALGALGYPVPADTPSPGRYKCGLCEAATLVAQDAPHPTEEAR